MSLQCTECPLGAVLLSFPLKALDASKNSLNSAEQDKKGGSITWYTPDVWLRRAIHIQTLNSAVV